jgi:protein TonB
LPEHSRRSSRRSALAWFVWLGVLASHPLSAQTAPLRVGGNIGPPTKIRHVGPQMPDAARQARVQGIVILEITVDESGRVSDAKVLRSIPLLDQAALDAVRQWEYRPSLLNGVAVPVVMTVTVPFYLDSTAPDALSRVPPPTRVPGAVGQPPPPFSQQSAVDRTTWRVPMATGFETYELSAERVQTLPPWDPAISYEPPLSASRALSIAVDFFRQMYPAAGEFELHHLNLVKIRAWLYQIQVGSPAVGSGSPATVRVFVLMDGSVLRPIRIDPLPGR